MPASDRWNGRSLRLIESCRDSPNFRDFFVLVVIEGWMDERNKSKNSENKPNCHYEAFHGADTNIERTSADRNFQTHPFA